MGQCRVSCPAGSGPSLPTDREAPNRIGRTVGGSLLHAAGMQRSVAGSALERGGLRYRSSLRRAARAPRHRDEALTHPSQPLRVGLVIERFRRDGGGAESVTWRTAHALRDGGDEVSVLARESDDAPGIALHRLRAPRTWQPLRVLRFSRAATDCARRLSLDVVYSLARTAEQDVYRAGAGSHADYLEARHPGLSGALRRVSPRHAALLALERRVFRDPDQFVICNSHAVRRQIVARYAVPEERIAVLYNGVDLETFQPRPEERSRVRDEVDPSGPADAPVWLFAANDYARKGLDTALDALARAQHGRSRLWVAGGHGDPPLDSAWRRRALELGIGERVRFLGPRRDLGRVFAAADGLILPTRYDAFANVCLEAASSGLPVLTSTANGAAELFQGIGPAPLPATDASAFAAQLDALASADARRAIGAQMRSMAERHGWARHVAELRALLRRRVSERRSAATFSVRRPAFRPGL